ncbi:MAG: hypothetical protein HLX50_03585, partial [Alteromonadaceae bacterium]|nr:hypothetical protein [Alteromonadaceae bacterium]
VSVRSIKTHSTIRVIQIVETWKMSLENFPFGMGPQSWLTHEILTEDYRKAPKYGHPHNMYLMWAAEYGWLLISALLVLVGQAIGLFWRRRKQVRSGEHAMLALPLVAFTASVSAALLHAGVSAVFMAPGSMLIGLLVLSVFWALITPDREPVVTKHPRIRAVTAVFAGLLISVPCYYWLKEVSAYHQAMERDLESHYKKVPAGMLPRFWLHGNYPRHPSQMP